MKYTSEGFFKARAFTAAEALPVVGAVVRIYEGEEKISGADFSLKTGVGGVTEQISLPAPDIAYSQLPNSPEEAYAVYNVEVSADGFYEKRINNVAIFANTLSVLPLEMIPNSGMQNYVNPPSDTNFSQISENEELE
jgi:hypothetical protein